MFCPKTEQPLAFYSYLRRKKTLFIKKFISASLKLSTAKSFSNFREILCEIICNSFRVRASSVKISLQSTMFYAKKQMSFYITFRIYWYILIKFAVEIISQYRCNSFIVTMKAMKALIYVKFQPPVRWVPGLFSEGKAAGAWP